MNQLIVEAIRSRQRLRFTYNGRARVVEPQCYGLGTRGTELLRAHQVDGGAQREPLFDVSKMSAVTALNIHFMRPAPNYRKNDSAMRTIYCQL